MELRDLPFGGTFDEALAGARGADDEVYKEQNLNEFIARKLTQKTRRYLTSGGKTYVSDGIAGKHSPFAKSFIQAMESQGGKDGILTVSEVYGYVEKLKNPPRLGDFGSNLPGSDFLWLGQLIMYFDSITLSHSIFFNSELICKFPLVFISPNPGQLRLFISPDFPLK